LVFCQFFSISFFIRLATKAECQDRLTIYRFYNGQTKDQRFKILVAYVKILEFVIICIINREELFAIVGAGLAPALPFIMITFLFIINALLFMMNALLFIMNVLLFMINVLLFGAIALLFGADGFYQGRPQGSPLRSQFIAMRLYNLHYAVWA